MKAPKVKAFKHQDKSLKHAEKTPIVFDCSDPGTGKTFVAILAAAKRIRRKRVRKVLVLAPKSLLRSVWAADIKKFAPDMRAVVSVAGKHEDAFAQDADFYITNIDAVKWLAKQPKKFFAQFDELIVDESAAYKHHTSQRSKAAAKVAKHFEYRRLMTGTPTGNTITDVWHQVHILDEGKRLGHSFFAFRNAVCTPVQKSNHNANAVEWVDKEGAETVVFGMLSDIVIRHKFEDCVDIPPNHQYCVPYEMTPLQQRTYDHMESMAIAEIYGSPDALALAKLKGTKPKPLGHITAINAAAVHTKLLQIASGAVYESPDKYHVVDTARYELILDLVEARQHSLVFFFWKHQRDMLIEEAKRRKIKFALIDGSVPENERHAIVQAYQAGMYQTVFAHPKSAAHGYTMTRGTAAIWASPTYDLELFLQGSKRQHRMGQTQKTETIVVAAEGTIDTRAYARMQDKGTRMSSLLSLFETL